MTETRQMVAVTHGVNNDTVRQMERASIRDFVASCSDHLTGVVLDYGCGKQPYREIVEAAGGEYHGFDRVAFPGNVSEEDFEFPRDDRSRIIGGYDAILCTQVLQYVPVYGDEEEIFDSDDYFSTMSRETPLFALLDDWHDILTSRSKFRRFSPPGHLILTYGTNWDEVEPADLTRWTKAGMEWLLGLAGFTVVRHERRAEVLLGGFRFPLGYGVLARA